MAPKQFDILITGSLVDTDIILAEHLSRLGLNIIVVRKPNQATTKGLPKNYLKAFSLENFYLVDSPYQFLRLASQSRLLISITGTLILHLRFLWPLRRILNLPPVVNLTTGSDITELADDKQGTSKLSVKLLIKKMFYRQYLNYVDLNWCLPMPHALDNIVKLKLRNVVFMNGFPYPILDKEYQIENLPHSQVIQFFHCSNLDWNYTDFSETRNSTKGNDKFIRAFIRALKDGYPVELSILDRGPDRNVAKDMFQAAGVNERIHWLPNLTRDQLYQKILDTDVTVNMFGHGGAGGISFETLALGRPVMQYANPTYFRLMYGETLPPFINCRTEDEIYQKIVWCCATNELTQIAAEGKKWVADFISPDKSLTKFLFYYSLLTGDIRLNFGEFIDEMKGHIASVKGGNYQPLKDLA